MKKIGFGIICVLLITVALILAGYGFYYFWKFIGVSDPVFATAFSLIYGVPLMLALTYFFSEEVYPKFQEFNKNRIRTKIDKLKEQER